MKGLSSDELRPKGNTVLRVKEMVEVWRYLRGQRIPCTFSMGALLGFDYDAAMELCGTPIREGYYFANHADQTGNYLGLNWNKDAVSILLEKGYASLEQR